MNQDIQLGKYVLKEELGRGGFGTIYRAIDTTLNVERAVKILHPAYNADPVFIERFRQEARTAARLEHHPNVVPVIELGQHEGAFYLVMSLMRGGSLKDLLEENGGIPITRAVEILKQISTGLDFAHNLPERLIHRDIKPANILLDRQGNARVSDFGFAKALEGSNSVSLSASGGMIGTPPYMAPELWRGKSAGPATDIYSLVCLFYEMVTGETLFSGNSPAEIMTQHMLDGPDLERKGAEKFPAMLRPVLERGLAQEPEDRYPSAGDFYEAVRDALQTAETGAEPEKPPQVIEPKTTETEISPEEKPTPIPVQPKPQTKKQPSAPPEEKATPISQETRIKPPIEEALKQPKTSTTAPSEQKQTPKQPWWRQRNALIGAGCLGIVGILACGVYGVSMFWDWVNGPIVTEVATEAIIMETEDPGEITQGPDPADSPEITPSSPPTEELPPDPRTLVICMGEEPESLYPYSDDSIASRQIQAALYDGPVDFVTFEYQPVIVQKIPRIEDGDALLEVYSVSRGEEVVNAYGSVVKLDTDVQYFPKGCTSLDCSLVYTENDGDVLMNGMIVLFDLLPGLTWSDGHPLTAHDSVFSFEMAAGTENDNANYYESVTMSYTALDDLTIEWKGLPGYIDHEYYDNIWTPLPRHILGDLTPDELLKASASNFEPLGYGPYALEEWNFQDSIVLRKNKNYFRASEGLPIFDTVIFRFIGPDASAALEALAAGECDILDRTIQVESQLDLLIELEQKGVVRAVYGHLPMFEHIDFGLRPACLDEGGINQCLAEGRPDYFGDSRVRQAIASCIDRQLIIDVVTNGQTIIMDTYVPQEHPLYNPDINVYPYDPELGMALLDETGFVDNDGDGIRETFEGFPLAFTYMISELDHRQVIAEIVAEHLSECGIKINVQISSTNEFFDAVFNYRFELAQFAWGGLGYEPSCNIWTTSEFQGYNNTGYSNSRFDSACQDALNFPNESQRERNHFRAQSIFAEDLPLIPLYMHMEHAASRPDMCSFRIDTTVGADTWNIEELDYGSNCIER